MLGRPMHLHQPIGNRARKLHARHLALLARIRSTGVAPAILAGTRGCLFIESDPRDPAATWCGAERMGDFPYCKEHALRAYRWDEAS